jgi:hypothetical protein
LLVHPDLETSADEGEMQIVYVMEVIVFILIPSWSGLGPQCQNKPGICTR